MKFFDEVKKFNNQTIRQIFPSYSNYFEKLVKFHQWLAYYMEVTEKMLQSIPFWFLLSLTLVAFDITPNMFGILWPIFMVFPLNLLNLINNFLTEEREKGVPELQGFSPKKAGWDVLGKRIMVAAISVNVALIYRHYLTENRKLMGVIAKEKRKIVENPDISEEMKKFGCESIDKTAEHGSLLNVLKDSLL